MNISLSTPIHKSQPLPSYHTPTSDHPIAVVVEYTGEVISYIPSQVHLLDHETVLPGNVYIHHYSSVFWVPHSEKPIKKVEFYLIVDHKMYSVYVHSRKGGMSRRVYINGLPSNPFSYDRIATTRSLSLCSILENDGMPEDKPFLEVALEAFITRRPLGEFHLCNSDIMRFMTDDDCYNYQRNKTKAITYFNSQISVVNFTLEFMKVVTITLSMIATLPIIITGIKTDYFYEERYQGNDFKMSHDFWMDRCYYEPLDTSENFGVHVFHLGVAESHEYKDRR